MRKCQIYTILVAFLLCFASPAVSMHPQDGPHADLRVAIEDDLVRFSVGVNLAFLDETIDAPREALNELSPEESTRVLDAFRSYLIERATCEINGTQIAPVFERLEIFTHPDPGMISIFPKTGARALIRATAVMRFDAPFGVETVSLTWPAYPLDLLAQEMETASTTSPRMYFEAVLTAGGRSAPAKFTHAEPTLQWSRTDTQSPDPLLGLPSPTVNSSTTSPPVTVLLLIVLAIAGVCGWCSWKQKAFLKPIVLSGCTITVLVALYMTAIAPQRHRPAPPLLEDEDAVHVLHALHRSMYRAFDYTSESEIYDRLAFALDGDLLADLYEQIRLSLLQAEEEMKVGVVTDLEPIETTVLGTDDASVTPDGLGFTCLHRWRVEGTVYHWGHSHTRAHLYEAEYRVSHTPGGWRITGHELRSQQRIDPSDGKPVREERSIQDLLKEQGLDDI